MCTSLFLYDLHPGLLLLLAFNRDEFWDRPTYPAHFWPDEPHLLAGRDALRSGTWLGMTKHGRFAFLTNFREPLNVSDPSTFVKTTAAPSRGALTTDFLTSTMTPLEYLQNLEYQHYCGFNLLVGDLQLPQVAYVSNRGQEGPKVLPPGAYGVSNGLLQQWPKVHKGLAALKRCISVPATAPIADQPHHTVHSQSESALASSNGSNVSHCSHGGSTPAAAGKEDLGGNAGSDDLPWHALFDSVLGDTQTVGPGEELPLTGVGEALDQRLSAIFVEPFEMQPGTKYGTRSQTIIAVWRDGRVEQRERYVEKAQQAEPGSQQQQQEFLQPQQGDQDSEWVWREVKHSFHIAPAAAAVKVAPADGAQQMSLEQNEISCSRIS